MSSYEQVDKYYSESLLDNEDCDSGQIKHYFNSELTSKPIKSESCTIDDNIIQLHHSFGYDCCAKIFNICAADDHTVVYASGSYIHMFDVNDGSLSLRKCAGNGGIGHIAKNPVLNHIAIGENGDNPVVIVYEWPTFEVISVLKGSAKKHFNWLTYSENGNYLCSQGGEPDNTITIWDWLKSKIVLKTKSHTQDVHVCRFSTFIPDHLITAGSEHIKFWKMAETFSGLKLQGRLGRFGKTEISSVIGIYSMPDEKVISGCEWGNILVWDEEYIHMQVMRKGKKPCHSGPIIMFLYSKHNMELTSVGMDGTIKFWYYHTIDTADPFEKDRVLEMEPSFTITVQDNIGIAKIMGMCKINNDPNSFDYFVQDGNGGIWLVDIEVSANAKPVKRLSKFHGDSITSLQASPIGYFIATSSLDGWFHVYDVLNKKLIFIYNFKVPITSLVWLPLKIANSGNIFVIGFQTGILKLVAAPLKEINVEKISNLVEIQSSKPHTNGIKHLTINKSATALVCGSDDRSIFVYEIESEPLKLNPVGMYPLPGKVTYICWKPSEEETALISCDSGHIVEVKIPTSRPSYTKESFLLKLETRVIETVSIQSEIYCNHNDCVDSKFKKKIKKSNGIAREENAGLEINEVCVEDPEIDKEPPKSYVPLVPNPILFAIYTPSEKTLWVSIDGYDAGYLYEYDFETLGPITATLIPNKNNTPLTAIEVLGTDSLTILMGFNDGRVRITNIKEEDNFNLSDYIEYPIHNNKSGRVKMFRFSQDNHMLYTYGDDGNIFSFMFRCDYSVVEKNMISASELSELPTLFKEDIIKSKEDLKLSLEERKINKVKWKTLNLANREKDEISCLLYGLKEKFKQVSTNNKLLPEPMQLSQDYFQFDERISNTLIKEAQDEMDKLHLKLMFDYEKSSLGLKKIKNYFVDRVLTSTFEVKAILKDAGVKTLYHEVRDNLFRNLVEEFKSKKHPERYLEEIKDPTSVRRSKSTVPDKFTESHIHKVTESEIFLRNVCEMYPSLPKKIQIAIDKFAARINFENKEIRKIKSMNNERPDYTKFDLEEETEIERAWETIGDFNLKSASDFKLSDEQVVSMEDKFDQYTNVQDEIYNLKSSFNEEVFDLKQRKMKLIHDYEQFKFDVCMIQDELNDPEITTPSDFPNVSVDESIDLNLIDSFEPVCYSDPMFLILHPEKNDVYSNMVKNELPEEPSHLETVMKHIRKEKLKYRHKCLHESMLMKINMFDEYLLKLETKRIDVKLRVTFLELFALTLEEELLILNDFDLLENEYSYNVYLKTRKQNDKINQIQKIREDIKSNNKIIEKKSNKLTDIQHTFDLEIRNNNFAKHLKRIFKKNLKTSKAKSNDCDDEDDSLSSSSSDISDYCSSESVDNGSGESLTVMAQIAVFDENVIPEGCDPKLFDLTFELRSQRQEIEQLLETTGKKVELLNKNLSLAHSELGVIENELTNNIDELEAYRVKKQLKLNDVETTILLKKSQTTKATFFDKAILVHGNIMQDLTNRVTELKKERKDIKEKYKEEKLHAKMLRTEINEMEHVLKKYKVAIKDEMMKKFRMETDWNFLDNMEMAIINQMIIQTKSNAEEMKEHFIKEIDSLKNKVRTQQDLLTEILGVNTIKLITLKALYESTQQLQQSLSIQQKISKKVQDLSMDDIYSSDIATLKNTFNTLLKQKQDICKEINTLKYKGKMFPPIVKQTIPSINKSQNFSVGGQFSATPTIQEESEEASWTISEQESYNMEFNMEPKISASSKQSSQLAKQSSHYDSFENTDEMCGENDWKTYYDDTNVPECVENFGEEIFNENDEVQNIFSEDNESISDHESDIASK